MKKKHLKSIVKRSLSSFPILLLICSLTSCSESPRSVSNNFPTDSAIVTSTEPSQTQSPAPVTAERSTNDYSTKSNACDFSEAKTKAMAKITDLGYKFVDYYNDNPTKTEGEFEEDQNNCRIKLFYVVKEVGHDEAGNEEVYDKIYHLKLSYGKYSSGFELLGAQLYDFQNNTSRTLL